MIEINGMPLKDFIKDATKQAKEGITSISGGMVINNNGETIVKGGSVTITRNGKRHVLRGNNIIKKRDGQWYVDGKAVDWNDLGGKYEEENVVSIEINGNVQLLNASVADVVVHGDVQNLKTGSGDVQCENAVNVSTGSGDVHCGDVAGLVSTGSGNVYRK